MRAVGTTVGSVYCPAQGKYLLTFVVPVKDTLLAARRMEQSGFTLARSTIDRIATLNLILQGRREFQQPLWAAYVDLKAAFDSVDRSALWLLLHTVVWVCLPRLWI